MNLAIIGVEKFTSLLYHITQQMSMHINARRLLAAAFILIFLIGAPLLVLYAAGFRWNFKKWAWQKTGSIYIEIEPKDADIILNGKKINAKIPSVINALSPNAYTIKIEKENYVSWERTIEVLPEKTSIIKDVVLLPKNIKRQKKIEYSINDSPVAKQKSGVFVYAENIWKFNPEKREASGAIATDDASFAILKDGKNGLIIGSISNNIFEEKDHLKEVNDFFWDEKDLILTVSSGLELIQYKFGVKPLEKNLIMRSSSNIERLLPIRDSIYTMILQKEQIKIVERDSYGSQIAPLANLETGEKLIFWEMNKKLNISIWTQTGENLRNFEINLLK